MIWYKEQAMLIRESGYRSKSHHLWVCPDWVRHFTSLSLSFLIVGIHSSRLNSLLHSIDFRMKPNETTCFSYSLHVPNSMSFPRLFLWLGVPFLSSMLVKLLPMLQGVMRLFCTSDPGSILTEDVLSVRSSEAVSHILSSATTKIVQ